MSAIAFFAAAEQTVPFGLVVGFYLCISGTGLLRTGEASRFLADLSSHPAALHAVGGIALFVGGFILAFHRSWDSPAAIVVNLVAALWVFEGAGMLADPPRLRAVFASPKAAPALRAAQYGHLLTGAFLLLAGLISAAK